jgi:fatty-acyl-CoA synthase
MHLSRHIRRWARERGDVPAITFGEATLTWGAYDARAEALAAHFADLGVAHGDRVACLLPNGLAWCVVFAAAAKLGAIFVPLNNLFGPFELSQIAESAECAAVVSTPALIGKIAPGLAGPGDEVLVYDLRAATAAASFDTVTARDVRVPEPPDDGSDILLISYTSGTTGRPKGAMLTHAGVEAMTRNLAAAFALGEHERFLILAPLAFTGGVVSNLTPAIILGARIWLEPGVDPPRALQLLGEHRITMFGGVPALWQRIAEAPRFAAAELAGLKGTTGGAPVPAELLEAYNAKGVRIRQQYGFTEACGGVCSPDEAGALSRPEACGRALPGMELEIRDDVGQPAAPGAVGEIHARGGQLMRGYWRDADATAAAFDGEWYRTGDLGRWNEHGELLVVDRKKSMLISGGVNVYPAEVERAMASLPGVVEVAVLGLPSQTWGDEVVALVHAPGLDDPAPILRGARELLGPYKAPKQVRLSPTPLPRTASNKIARAGLGELWRGLDPQPAAARESA